MGNKLAEALRKNRERSSKSFLPFYKFPEGKTDIRVLPAAKGDDKDEWFVPVGMHYAVDEKRPINCPYETNWAEDPCPICEMVRELRTDGMNDEANRMSVRRQYLVRAIVRGEEEKGAQIIRLPSTLFQAVGEFIEDTDEYGNILSPGPKGRDIRVTRVGKDFDTRYSAIPRIKASQALDDKKEVLELLGSFEPIASLVSVPTFDEIEKIINEKLGYTASIGDSFDDDDDDDDDNVSSDDDDDVDEPTGAVDAEEVDDFFGEEDDDDDDDSGEKWLDEDANDDNFDSAPEVDEEEKVEEKPKKSKATVKADLEKDLGKKHNVGKKRGKSRTKKG